MGICSGVAPLIYCVSAWLLTGCIDCNFCVIFTQFISICIAGLDQNDFVSAFSRKECAVCELSVRMLMVIWSTRITNYSILNTVVYYCYSFSAWSTACIVCCFLLLFFVLLVYLKFKASICLHACLCLLGSWFLYGKSKHWMCCQDSLCGCPGIETI